MDGARWMGLLLAGSLLLGPGCRIEKRPDTGATARPEGAPAPEGAAQAAPPVEAGAPPAPTGAPEPEGQGGAGGAQVATLVQQLQERQERLEREVDSLRDKVERQARTLARRRVTGPQRAITGRVVEVNENELILSSGRGPQQRLLLDDQSRAVVDGKVIPAAELAEGEQVRAAYREKNGEPVVVRVQETAPAQRAARRRKDPGR